MSRDLKKLDFLSGLSPMPITLQVLTEPRQARKYEGKFGEMTVWKFDLQNEGEVELHKKAGNKPPDQGERLTVTDIQERDHNGTIQKRIKVEKPQGAAFSQASTQRPQDPAKEKSIRRQSAQQRAALYLIAKAMAKQHLGVDVAFEEFKRLVDGIERDAE